MPEQRDKRSLFPCRSERSAKNKSLMEAASSPGAWANAVTHENKNNTGDGSALPLRGGSYYGNESRAGVFALMMKFPRAFSTHDVGFRAALLSGRMYRAQGPYARAERQKGPASVPIGKVGKKQKPHGSRQ